MAANAHTSKLIYTIVTTKGHHVVEDRFVFIKGTIKKKGLVNFHSQLILKIAQFESNLLMKRVQLFLKGSRSDNDTWHSKYLSIFP